MVEISIRPCICLQAMDILLDFSQKIVKEPTLGGGIHNGAHQLHRSADSNFYFRIILSASSFELCTASDACCYGFMYKHDQVLLDWNSRIFFSAAHGIYSEITSIVLVKLSISLPTDFCLV